MPTFNRLNNFIGWSIFGLTTLVYIIAIEPTASFWDCGEFIAAAYKLEVPHPPGAPFYLLLGRIFSLFAADAYAVGVWVNGISVLSSSFTILFLYWSIVLLAKKVAKMPSGGETPQQMVMIIGSGVLGALVYAFSDSFWSSAEEAEVYALSSFFLALIFWAALKWETLSNEQQSYQWLILIAYLIGLSIGVHLLNLLCIPAMALLYYFKKWAKTTSRGMLTSLLLGLLLVGIIEAGIIPGLPSLAFWFELQFVNGLGLPFASGIIFFTLLVIGALVWGIIYSQKHQKVILNTALLCLSFLLIGYASYALVVIRSSFNPPIDQNNPNNILSFIYYLKREQYGERPLLWGNYFDAEVTGLEKGSPVYKKGPEGYEVAYYKNGYSFSEQDKTILPRIHSIQPDHQVLYRQWLGLQPHQKPTFKDNLSFMFSYQLGHMYWRYFMWNFAGRESDHKDAGWLSPVAAFKTLPRSLSANKAHNNFLMLPLLLGLAGAFFQYKKNKEGFALVAVLFLTTGALLVLYLNSPPIEPRERDYIYVGSFYAFAIWIGFGFYGLSHVLLNLFQKSPQLVLAVVVAFCLLIPGLMAAEGWDDHDRSDRYFSVDSARNMLVSCAPNAILFTGGDNDTYPLWYVQEVEGFRTDVRVVVLPYLNAPWFVNQLRQQKNRSAPLPFSLSEAHYQEGGLNDVLYHVENKSLKGPLPLDQYLSLLRENHPAIRLSSGGETFNTLPSKVLGLSIDREAVLAKGIIPEGKEALLPQKMIFKVKGNNLYKSDLLLLDLIATNNWERPVYFNNTSLQAIGLELEDWVVHEGTAYRLLPIQNTDPQTPLVNTAVMYENLMQQFSFRELDNPKVYYAEEYRRLIQNHRATFNTLAEALLEEGKISQAREVVARNLAAMPDTGVPYDITTAQTVNLLLATGQEALAVSLADLLVSRANEWLQYLTSENIRDIRNLQINLFTINQLARSMAAAGLDEKAMAYQQQFERHYSRVSQKL